MKAEEGLDIVSEDFKIMRMFRWLRVTFQPHNQTNPRSSAPTEISASHNG